MSNKIYTIGREFGSGGKAVGEALANRLGIKLYDKELLQQAAKVAFAKRFLKITMKNQPAAFYTHWSWIHTPLEATILHRFLICR